MTSYLKSVKLLLKASIMTGIRRFTTSEFNKGCQVGRNSEPKWVEDTKRRLTRKN